MKLYTTTICPKCLFVKSEMARKGIEAEIINVEEDIEAYKFLEQQNITEAPVLMIEDRLIKDVYNILAELEKIS